MFGKKPDKPVISPQRRTESYSHEVYVYDMDDFRERLGLRDEPHDILTVHIKWDRKVEVQMSSRLRGK